MSGPRRPSFLPENRQFSQADERVVQRPDGLDGGDAFGVEIKDVVREEVRRYSEMMASPGKYDEAWPITAQPQKSGGGTVILVEKDLGFMCHAFAIDNWTNQWLFEENAKRFIPAYSGPWIISVPRGFQTARLLLRAPAAFTPPAALAGEFCYCGWHEAYLPPMNGVTTLVKTPVTA